MTKASSSKGQAWRGVSAVAGIVLFGLVLAACSSSTNTAATTTTAAGGSTSATTGGSGSGGSSVSSQISALTSHLQAANRATFKAVYTATESGTNQTVTIEQSPPKSLFSAGSGVDINTGTTSYFCSTANGQNTCYNAGASNPLASLAALFSPATVRSALRTAQTEAAAHAAGYDVSFSTQSFAGQSATCASIAATATNAKYCVTDQGVLAYAGSSSGSFTLTSYSSAPPASDFALPAGATVVTIP